MLIRKARMGDVAGLMRLVNGYASMGIMLPRTEFELAEGIRDFVVADADGVLAGCGALHFYTPQAGEIRSLAVDPAFQKTGLGRKIVEALEVEAAEAGLVSLFAFTYVPDFFARLGYEEVDRGALPSKAWKDCLRCPKCQNCDEIAVVKHINSEHIRHEMNGSARGVASPVASSHLIPLSSLQK